MTRVTRLLVIAFAGALVASLALAPASQGKVAGTQAEDAEAEAAPTQVLRVRPGHLLHHDGAQLYQELCASCHGAAATGNGPEARALAVPPPPLTHLRRAGVPRQHWTYVIRAGCEDHHHWAPDGSATMPCWRRVFRQALGNEAAPLLVSTKLVAHLESLQK